jgi:hypothetical protein
MAAPSGVLGGECIRHGRSHPAELSRFGSGGRGMAIPPESLIPPSTAS